MSDETVDETGTDDTVDEAAADAEGANPDRAVAVAAYLAKALADQPDAVNVGSELSGDQLHIDVKVAEGDLGRVIGKRGKVAGSVRSLVRAAAHMDGLKVDVDFD